MEPLVRHLPEAVTSELMPVLVPGNPVNIMHLLHSYVCLAAKKAWPEVGQLGWLGVAVVIQA